MPDGLERRRCKSWFTARATSPRRAEITIYDEIGAWGVTSKDFIEVLKALGEPAVIDVRLNSGGGDVFDGLAIYHALKRHPARIDVWVDGLAASIASIIAMAGDAISMPENSYLMIHDPSAFVVGRAEDMSKMAETLRSIKQSLVNIYARRTGIEPDEIASLMADETWFDGPTAVARGFATALIDAEPIAAHFDLGKFSKVPADARRLFGGTQMDVTTTTDRPVATPPVANVEVAAINAAWRAARRLDLLDECERLLDAGTDPGEVPGLLIEAHAHRAQRVSNVQRVLPSGGAIQTRHDEAMITEALTCRLMGASATGNPWSQRSLIEIARARIEAAGYNASGLTREEIFFPRIRAAASHTTSDFPLLLSGAVNKSLLSLYQQVESPLKQIARQNNHADFKAGSIINLGQFPALDEVLEDAEIKHGSIDEAAESWRLKSYGKIFSITFQSLVNDDLSGFGDWARMAAISAAQAEGDLLFALLSANSYAGATLSDGAALFHSSHSNVAASGTAFDLTNFGAAVAALRKQTGLGSTVPLGVQPAFVLCGPGKELSVRQVLSSAIVPNAAADANPWAGQVQVLVEARFLSRNDWYVFGAPRLWPVAEWGYLNSAIGPQISTQESFERLAISTRLVLHFGCGAVDFRGAYRNAGV